MLKHLLPIFILYFYTLATSSAQNQGIVVQYSLPDSLYVCGEDTLFIHLQNGGTQPVTGNLTVKLPDGIRYEPGTVTGASEQNIGNLTAPVFAAGTLTPGISQTITLMITADCVAARGLNAGSLFPCTLEYVGSNASVSVVTNSIPIETGLLLIESVDDVYMEGERYDTLLRKICVKNTRLGAIKRVFFEDSHSAGISISMDNVLTSTSGTTLFTAEIAPALISTTGDNDELLELGETICFTEKIVIQSCGTPSFLLPSMLRAGWGCGTELCTYDSIQANILVKPSSLVPDLNFTGITSPIVSQCAGEGARMGVKIVNTGGASAKNVIVNTTFETGIGANAFDQTSVILSQSGVETPIIPNIVHPNDLFSCDPGKAASMTLVIPEIKAGDTATLTFDLLTCASFCNQTQADIRIDYYYQKDCPPGGFVSGYLNLKTNTGAQLNEEIFMDVEACLTSGNSYPVTLKVRSPQLLTTGRFLHIDMELPPGISLDPGCPGALAGANPVSYTQLPGGRLHWVYALPLPSLQMQMDFCIRYDCDPTVPCPQPPAPDPDFFDVYVADCTPCIRKMSVISFISGLSDSTTTCGIGICREYDLVLEDCSSGGGGGGGTGNSGFLPGNYQWKFDAFRLNIGYKDSNDDRTADDGSRAVKSEIRRDRFLAGDTMRVEYCGYVDTGKITILPRNIFHEALLSDMANPENDSVSLLDLRTRMFEETRFRFLGDSMRIRYADGSSVSLGIANLLGTNDNNFIRMLIPNKYPDNLLDQLSSQKHSFGVNFGQLYTQGLLPKPVIGPGDSIFFYTDFKIDLNYNETSDNPENPVLVGIQTALSHGDRLCAWTQIPLVKQQYSGFRFKLKSNTFNIRPCEPSLEVSNFNYSLRIARANLFTREVRPLGVISAYRLTVPGAITASSVKINQLILQDNLLKTNNIALPFVQTPGFLDVDFSPAFASLVDEGFLLTTNTVFDPNCTFKYPDTSQQIITTTFEGCLNGDKMVFDTTLRNQIGYFSNYPDLDIKSADTVIVSDSRQFEADFDLKNLFVNTAKNVWLNVQSSSGLSSNFHLLKMPAGQPVPAVNDLFNLPNLSGFSSSSFRLTGETTHCATDTLLLIYGWDCSTYTDISAASCSRDTFRILVRLAKPELELDIVQEDTEISLCDTSGYYIMEIYNANSGYAYDISVTAKLPPGMEVEPGTCQVQYTPSGWINTSDPAVSGNLLVWKLADLVPSVATNGLPGINQSPANTVFLRFRVRTSCGFVSNTPIIYGVSGKEPCGASANRLNKPGEQINVQGLSPTYGVSISVSQVFGSSVCGTLQTFQTVVTLLGNPSPGDSIYVILPEGVIYLTNSYDPGPGAPSGPPTIIPDGFRLPLPQATAGSQFYFFFEAKFRGDTGCKDLSLTVQTRVKTAAYCATLGAPCDIYIATGSSTIPLQVLHPELEIESATTVVRHGQITVGVNLGNNGTVFAYDEQVNIWFDRDGSGTISAGDTLLLPIHQIFGIGPGEVVLLTDSLPFNPAYLCGLIVELPADQNCLCSSIVLPLLQIEQLNDTISYCNLTPVQTGVPAQVGATYTWLPPADGVACLSCATTTFTPQTLNSELRLLEKTGDCEVIHRFFYDFGENAFITLTSAAVCVGDSVRLEAQPPGQLYNWSGAGITAVGTQSQLITAVQSGIYQVTITLDNGCTATTSAQVIVFPPDSTALPVISSCEGETITVLGNSVTATEGVFSLILSNRNGCDSIVTQSVVILDKKVINEEISFCTGTVVPVLDTVIAQSGTICRTYTGSNGCDSIHCVTATAVDLPDESAPDTLFSNSGVPVTLGGIPGYASYTWYPAVNCDNCQEITVTPDSSGYFEYTLVITNNGGCADTIVWRVVVSPPCGPEQADIPNAFTPNGDGSNDTFAPVVAEGGPAIGRITIYDRWGEKLYEYAGAASWDGNVRGKPAVSDVYIYIIELECSGDRFRRVGNVTLIR
jgi:gliding motility-associated-like protein